MPKQPKSPRDEATLLVEANLRALISERRFKPANVRNHESETNTAIYDFLAGRSASVKVDTLAKWADALNVPLILLFAPPDKRDAIEALLGIASRMTAPEIDRLVAIGHTLADLSGPPPSE